MAGSRLEQVKNALQLFLRSLPSSCRFNILGFGNRVDVCPLPSPPLPPLPLGINQSQPLYPRPQTYSEENLNHASARVGTMKADRTSSFVVDWLKLKKYISE
jgi:hypothetical protein